MVTRERLWARIQGGSGKKGPKIPTTKLLAAEKSAVCRYIDRVDKINLAVPAELIADVANYILYQRSSQPETAPKVGKSWTTRFTSVITTIRLIKNHLTLGGRLVKT